MDRVYIAHPYGGKEENKLKVEGIIRGIIKSHPEWVPVSPIHATGFLYDSVDYLAGMNYCFSLLESCSIVIMCPGWQNSKGCCMEYGYAVAKHIPVIFEEDLNEQGN